MISIEEKHMMKKLLSEALLTLCKNGLRYTTSFHMEALIGVTLDDHDVILFSVNESIAEASAQGVEQDSSSHPVHKNQSQHGNIRPDRSAQNSRKIPASSTIVKPEPLDSEPTYSGSKPANVGSMSGHQSGIVKQEVKHEYTDNDDGIDYTYIPDDENAEEGDEYVEAEGQYHETEWSGENYAEYEEDYEQVNEGDVYQEHLPEMFQVNDYERGQGSESYTGETTSSHRSAMVASTRGRGVRTNAVRGGGVQKRGVGRGGSSRPVNVGGTRQTSQELENINQPKTARVCKGDYHRYCGEEKSGLCYDFWVLDQ